MKMKIKNRVTFLLMAVVFTLLISMSASAKTHRETKGVPFWSWQREYHVYSGPASGISKVRSSNKKVAVVATRKGGTGVDVYLKLKKPGTTNLSYKLKKNGKTVTYKTKLNIYKNPFKTLKVGKANYKSQFNNGDYSTLMEGQGKVKIKVKKGWKVKSIKVQSGGKWRKLKKGEKVDIENKHSLKITLKNTKDRFTAEYWIWGGGF